MGNTSSGTESVTQKQEPWSAAQPYLQNIFGQAQSLYNQGSEYFPGSTVVPFHGDTEAGLQGLREHYSQAPPGYEAATGTVSSIAGGTPSAPGQQLLMSSAGANPFVGDVSAAAGRSNTAGADVLQQFASTNVNPYLDAMFDRAAGKVRDNTNAMFSKAGRFGSTANQDALSDSLGDLATSMYGSAYESDTGRRLAAAEALGAREAGDINRNMQGAITVAGLDESRRGREASAGSTLNQQALQGSTLLPMLNEYGTSGDRGLMEVGSIREAQAGNELQDLIDRWNFSQNAGWDNLSRYNQIVQPIAGLGGSSTTTQPTQSKFGSALQGGAGGAMAGSAFGPWGTVIGGGLGVLGGLFG